MADESIAASSAADTTPAPSPSDALANASPEAYATWQRDGELPASETSETSETTVAPADSTPAEPASQAASTDAIPKAAPEPADKTKTEQRFQELLADRARERERADRLTREIAALRTPPPPVDARSAVSSTAPADDDPEPNPDDATKYADGIYDRRFLKDQAAWAARDVFRGQLAQARAFQQQQQAQAQSKSLMDTWTKRTTAAKTLHPDFDESRLHALIPPNSPIDRWILETEGCEAVMDHLASHPEEVARLQALPVIAQVRALIGLEQTLTPAKPKTVSDAPDPARTLGERATSPIDAVARAVATKDVAAFFAAEDARELALFRASGTR